MGKVILCAGKKAETPLVVNTAGIYADTIEELCYCLRQNLDLVDSGAVDRTMAAYIGKDLGLPERGELLERLINSRASLKEKLMAVFNSCSFYDENELARIESEIEELSKMSGLERRKKRADRQMEQGKLGEAASEYRNILASPAQDEISEKCRGDIMHNLAIFEIRRGDFDEAARLFLEAYESNANTESLKSYLYVLKLAKNNTGFADEVKRLEVDVRTYTEIETTMHSVEEDFEQSTNYNEINRMRVLWQQGRYSEEKRLSGEIIDRLKLVYRKENEEGLYD
jgi:tetratricopeptide (TPR) repeat protein